MPRFHFIGPVAAAVAFATLPATVRAQSPVATALRDGLAAAIQNFIGSVERMPETKFTYRPTPVHMTYAEHILHVADFSATMCGLIGDVTPPLHSNLSATAPKSVIEAHLKDALEFCADALANVDDTRLGDSVPYLRSRISRAKAIFIISNDWADHYVVTSTYLRLNGLVPPQAAQ
jgi:hypothetical protein